MARNPQNASIEHDAPVAKVNDNTFTWHSARKVEKLSFIAALVFVVAAIVFLVFEFIYEADSWPYIAFNFSIALAFACESVFNWNYKRSLAIINIIAAVAFFAIAIIRLFAQG